MTRLADYRHPPGVRPILARLAVVVCPPDARALGLVEHVVDHVELSMRAMPTAVRAALLSGLAGFELGALAWPGHLGRRFSQLGDDQAERYFRFWWASPIGLLHEFAKGAKGLVCLAYYEMPQVKAQLGYTQDAWIAKVKARRLEVYGADIRQHEQALITPDPLPARASTAIDHGTVGRGAREVG